MVTWEDQHRDQASQLSVPTPEVKFETSPTESFLSTPGELYPTLFAVTPVSASAMDPLESALTPESLAADDSTVAAPSPAPATPVEGEKKPAKKRKSWGQVLPEPKTNLPPRKRAKTEDEKEQRRVERVLRNRRAAQSSRERKRQEVEALEKRNADLESALHAQQKQNLALVEELAKLRRSAGVVSRSPSPLDVFQPSPLTLSQPLFDQSASAAAQAHSGLMDDFILMPEQDGTVDPASIAPELNPIADAEARPSAATLNHDTEPIAASTAAAASSDLTQHPAAMLSDLQCLQSVGAPPSWMVPRQTLFLPLQTLLMASSVLISACCQPLTLVTGALKNNLVLQPTPSILSTIIWLVTLPPNFRNSTLINSSATTTSTVPHPARRPPTTPSPMNPNPLSFSSTLRIKSLQRLLTSSPILARPLMDATMEFLRFAANEGRDDQVDGQATGSPGIKGDQGRGKLLWPEGTDFPSREVLLTLLWAIKVEERKIVARERQNGASCCLVRDPDQASFERIHQPITTK